MKSICSHFAVCWPCAPMSAVVEPAEPARRCSGARAATAINNEIIVPISSMSAKPLTDDRDEESTSAVIAVDVRVEIVWKPAVAGRVAARTDFPARTSSLMVRRRRRSRRRRRRS
jgi:hypothetical protein